MNLIEGGRFVSTTATRSEHAPLLSPLIDLEYRPKCITFWQQLYSGHSVILKVYSVTETARAILHEETISNNGPVWTKAVVYTEMKGIFQVMYNILIHISTTLKVIVTVGIYAIFHTFIFGQMSSLKSCV